jgi:4-amino-4-deoxy-L-arabinose transferase-like glycosyltransferase
VEKLRIYPLLSRHKTENGEWKTENGRTSLFPLPPSLFLFAIALIIRLPYLTLIPHLTDETGEVLEALRVAQERAITPVGQEMYLGPVFSYLLAAAFLLFGPSIALPRAVMLLIGVLTVPLTYGLARTMAGRLGGFLAGALMATSFTHILINSHIAWSNSITPFFTTLALAVFCTAMEKGSGWLLALSGFLIGVALQTHPSVLVLIPGLVGWFLSQKRGRTWLRRPAPTIAALLALLAYSNMIWFNLQSGFESIAEASSSRNFLGGDLRPGFYAENVRNLLSQLLRMLSGAFRQGYQPLETLWEPAVLAYGLVLVAALFYAARRGKSLPLFLFVSTALLMPFFNTNYHGLHESRYLGFLLPVVYTAMGAFMEALLQPTVAQRNLRSLAIVATCVILVVYPLISLAGTYRDSMANGLNNARLLRMTNIAHEAHGRGAMVFLDKGLKEVVWMGAAGDHPLRGLKCLLTLDGTPYTVADLSKMNWFLENAPENEYLLFLAPQNHAWLSEHHPLIPLDATPTPAETPYGLYRFASQPPHR